MSKWIRTDKKLPPMGIGVWVTIAGSDIVCPKEGETVLDCIQRMHRDFRRVSIGYYTDEGWNDYDGFPMIVHPIAWMPLEKPKAYRGQKDLYTPEELKKFNEVYEKRMKAIFGGDDIDDEDMI